MRDIRTAVSDLYASGEVFALATVIDTDKSAPVPAGLLALGDRCGLRRHRQPGGHRHGRGPGA
ncbi:hypothetical protein Q8A49_34775, partial [Nocardiopsis umidischolae]|nr:hypothetical protein [Nocardiopsis umidischolae]